MGIRSSSESSSKRGSKSSSTSSSSPHLTLLKLSVASGLSAAAMRGETNVVLRSTRHETSTSSWEELVTCPTRDGATEAHVAQASRPFSAVTFGAPEPPSPAPAHA